MRKLITGMLTCLAITCMAQFAWKDNLSYGTVYDTWDHNYRMQKECGYYPEGRNSYPADIWVKESRKSRKYKRKARKKGYQVAKANMEILTDRKNLAITVSIDAKKKEAFQFKTNQSTRKGGPILFASFSPIHKRV